MKSAVLLAGLGADGPTTVHESRAHPGPHRGNAGRRGRRHRGAHAPGRGPAWSCSRARSRPGDIDVPADPSQAAFWAVAACTVPGSDLVLEDVYVGRGRAGFLDVLVRMGARVELVNEDPVRHTADIHVQAGPLVATHVGGAEVPSLIDEIPVLCVAAALAEGTTTFADAAELRVKETDRVATTVALLAALWAPAPSPVPTASWSPGVRAPPCRVVRSTRTATTGSPWPPPSPLWARAGR